MIDLYWVCRTKRLITDTMRHACVQRASETSDLSLKRGHSECGWFYLTRATSPQNAPRTLASDLKDRIP